MASEEQLAVSDKIKKLHRWLRTRSQEVGPDQAWEEHLKRKDALRDYASAMKTLAEQFWAKTNQADRKNYCRIQWVRTVITDYFHNGLREKQIQKEITRMKLDTVAKPHVGKITLLDVGSCYNPFKQFEFCETYAIDLCPASPDVKQCNFLDVEVTEDPGWYSDVVKKIPGNFFDVVVFCLFLEYLPAANQRLRACQTAWDVLKDNGVLLIITPDSNHATANSSLMKSWKLALMHIGFIRFRIEKLKYLYCMAFRKTKYVGEYTVETVPEIMIPQDFVDYGNENQMEDDGDSVCGDYDRSLDVLPFHE